LLIDALGSPEGQGIRCLIAGEGEEQPALEHAIRSRGLSERFRLIGRVDDEELVSHLARCRAVCFPPFDEDYGFVTVEAFASCKPVITCTDSGGPSELVQDEVNGRVCPPQPAPLAKAMRMFLDDRRQAETLGSAGFDLASSMTWDKAVAQLLAP